MKTQNKISKITQFKRFVNLPKRFSFLSKSNTEIVGKSYWELLQDSRWKTKRELVLFRDNYKCIACNNPNNLHVHHKQYHYNKQKDQFLPPWEYSNHLLITLCSSCHDNGHENYKVPVKYI
jgi:5-methylcytosine-specific restriction endonuclease McrA